MYWMRGEGFGEKITIPQLKKFLDAGEAVLTANLSQLEKHGLVNSDFSETYELTETGIKKVDAVLPTSLTECSNRATTNATIPTATATTRNQTPNASISLLTLIEGFISLF